LFLERVAGDNRDPFFMEGDANIMFIQQFPEPERFRELAADHNVVPVCAEILADTETPVSLLRKLYADQGPVFLFESVEGGERWGRYSFLGGSARSHIRVFRDVVEVAENGTAERLEHAGDPLSVLRYLMGRYRPAPAPELPRFWGGLVGYLTYEMVSFFEAIPNRLPEDAPMASFMVPDELIIFDNIRNTLMAVAIAFPESAAEADAAYEDARSRLTGLLDRASVCIEPEPGSKKPSSGYALETPLDEEAFRQRVMKTKEYIRDGEIIQAVISQPFSCSPPPDLWTLYRAQRFVNPSPYLYFLHLEDTALVGSSPETMVRLENGVATLRPIAGTRPRGETEQTDRAMADELLADEKERAEHLMLVDLGRNDLGRVAETGSVQVTDLMVVERYSHVMHLVSNIACDLKPEVDAWDLLRATFPAGTLSGAPKVRAMEIIAELEETPRGPYGGAVGYVSFSGNMDMAITIRTACVADGELIVRAGAGVVADSDPERERQETVNKARAIGRALEMVGA
jgi:anthranilate synthase component 1